MDSNFFGQVKNAHGQQSGLMFESKPASCPYWGYALPN